MNPLGKISGTITNVETGEQWNTEHLLMDTGSYISLHVKVSGFECFTLPDKSYQIVAEGKGLDSIGNEFDVEIVFFTESEVFKYQIKNDFYSNNTFHMTGELSFDKDGGVRILNPSYENIL